MAQALVSLDAGSGASIFTIDSCPQRLHFLGRFWAMVSGLTFRIFPFPQIGQMTHPSLTIILPYPPLACNGVHPFLYKTCLFFH